MSSASSSAASRGEDAHAGRRAELELAAVDPERLPQGGQDLRGHGLGRLFDVGAEVGQHGAELVAAGAGDDVGVVEGSPQALRRLAQDGVAGLSAEAVVDQLEIVDPDVEQRDVAVAVPGAGEGQREVLLQHGPIRQEGQRVVEPGARRCFAHFGRGIPASGRC